VVSLMKRAERNGFRYGWTFDSAALSQGPPLDVTQTPHPSPIHTEAAPVPSPPRRSGGTGAAACYRPTGTADAPARNAALRSSSSAYAREQERHPARWRARPRPRGAPRRRTAAPSTLP
ncbi:hypothetical protein OV450_6260, partial [Actinobacteria bacterium OV450]